jgi:hypothetical protein
MSTSEDPERVAQSFLSALDDGRWRDAAELIHTETAERFWRQHVQLLRLREGISLSGDPRISDTTFRGPAELGGVRSVAEIEALSPAELLARFAEALDPVAATSGEAERASGAGDRRSVPGLVRTVLAYTLVDEASARVEYCARWADLEGPGEVHSLALRRMPQGWRVWDADLTGTGEGRIWLSDEVFAHLRATFGGT